MVPRSGRIGDGRRVFRTRTQGAILSVGKGGLSVAEMQRGFGFGGQNRWAFIIFLVFDSAAPWRSFLTNNFSLSGNKQG